MAWLGIRCEAKSIAIVLVEDGDDGPAMTFHRFQKTPDGLQPGEQAAWFAKVVDEALDEVDVDGVALRIADQDPKLERGHAEGAVLAAVGRRHKPTQMLRRQSLVKPLGVAKGQGAWASFQRDDPFVGGLVGKYKDAAMASLGALRK